MFSAKKTPSPVVSGGYRISRSLRFNAADSTHLTRNFASTGSTIWTVSCWHKRTTLGVSGTGYHVGIAGRSSSNSDSTINIDGSDLLGWTRNGTFNSTGVYIRDTASWYHFVTTYDNTNIRMYINGVLVHTAASLSLSRINSSTVTQHIGGRGDATNICEGYTAEFYFIDGQALTPSDFGETDSVTGVWKPKRYTGTYGTNGFYLDFSDNSGTTSSTLGKDRSGNNNDWTPNNFSVASGLGNDSFIDTPTPYADGGQGRGNYAVLSPLPTIQTQASNVFSNGGLQVVTRSGDTTVPATMAIPSTGKWYFEFVYLGPAGSTGARFGIRADDGTAYEYSLRNQGTGGTLYYDETTRTTTGGAFTVNDVIMVAVDSDTNRFWIGVNNTWLESGNPSAGTNPIATIVTAAGRRYYPHHADSASSASLTIAFVNGANGFTYTPPTGFKALNTYNIPAPTIIKGTDHFNTLLYTGTGSSRSVSGLDFSPDFVWIKNRSNANDHSLYDIVRGTTKELNSNQIGDETTQANGLTAFNSDGFTVGSLARVNGNGNTIAAWCWNESATPGLDIVTYTGNGANRTISHNLGVAPRAMFIKARTTAGTDQGWAIYHAGHITPVSTWADFTTAVSTTGSLTMWNSTAPTSTVFSVGTNSRVNTNADTYVAYLFSEVEGFSRIGSYVGNGSTDGAFVNCGFRPAFVIMKRSNGAAASWGIIDSKRDTTNEATTLTLFPDSNVIESATGPVDIVSNGFKTRSTSTVFNGNGDTYIYMAFAETPFKYALAR